MRTEQEINDMSARIKTLSASGVMSDKMLTEAVGGISALEWCLDRNLGMLSSMVITLEELNP
jgi:hypothetical protein